LPHKYILDIRTAAPGGAPLRIESGNHLHGLLFSLLAAFDPALAASLHTVQGKPFSLWPALRANGSISVVMATLSDEMAAALDKMSGNIHGLLGRYQVVVSVQKATYAPIEKLWKRAEKIDCIDGLRINFLSPTSFRRAGKQWLFPDPGVVFQNVYLKSVEVFGDFFRNNLTPPSEYTSQFMVSRYELATKQVDYGRYKIIGFCGYCVYDCRRMKLAYNCQSLAFLSALAEFTGIGYKTTMGMGQAECLPWKGCCAHVKQ